MKRYHFLTVLFSLIIMSACNENQLNQTIHTDQQYFQDETQLTKAVNTIYGFVQSVNLAGLQYYFLHDVRSDEMSSGGASLQLAGAELLFGVHSSNNPIIGGMWKELYQVIHQTNYVMGRIPVAKNVLDKSLVERRIGEAKFFRGWAYSELVMLWGKVPLLTKEVKDVKETYPRAPEEEVYQQIIADLNDAQAKLLYAHQILKDDLGRASKEAAQCILARVYMQRGEYAEAKAELLKVINSPSNFTLVPNYFDNFTVEGEFNKESIWEVGYAPIGDMNWEPSGKNSGVLNERTVRSQEYSALGWRNLIPTASLLDEFERPSRGDVKEDPRLKETFYFIGDKYAYGTKELTDDRVQGLSTRFEGVDRKVSWKKYSLMYKMDPGGYMSSAINSRMIRLAEVILNLAECENELNNGAKAIDYLNQIRSRASVQMPPYPTPRFPVSDQIEIRRAIQHERKVELAGEQIRNRDILRWRKLGTLTFGEPLSYFDPNKHALLPIPQAEIDTNDKIDPN